MRRTFRGGLAAVLAAVCGACETTRETSDGRPMPPTPREGPATPVEAPINAIAVVLGPKPVDSNNNLLPDTIEIEAYLFARPFPTPVWRAGTLTFAIYEAGKLGGPASGAVPALRTWTLTAEQLASVRSKSLVGECYAIALSLLENGGSDRIGAQAVDLVAIFTPAAGGDDVPLNGVRTISLAPATIEPGR